jgi:hypothetical protein
MKPGYIVIIVFFSLLCLMCLCVSGCGNAVANIGGMIFQGGKPLKKATTTALNMDIIKNGYNAYKKIKG